MNYAIINTSGDVINTIVWDGNNWQPPANTIAIEIPADVGAAIGWSYIDGQFISPTPLEKVTQ